MKVFLGGTCSGYDWRSDLIPKLVCDFYNPIVRDWSESDRLREVHEREIADIVLYTITNDIKGVYSIDEVTDDSYKRPEKTLFCNLYVDNSSEKDAQMLKSLKAVENLISSNSTKCFINLKDLAEYINSL